MIGVQTAQVALVTNRLHAKRKNLNPAKIALTMLLTPANVSRRLTAADVDIRLVLAVVPVPLLQTAAVTPRQSKRTAVQ